MEETIVVLAVLAVLGVLLFFIYCTCQQSFSAGKLDKASSAYQTEHDNPNIAPVYRNWNQGDEPRSFVF